MLPAEDVTVESDLGGLPALDDGDQAGDATGIPGQAALDGQFEAGLSTKSCLHITRQCGDVESQRGNNALE